MSSTRIYAASASDADRVVHVMTLAFVADPAMRWLYPTAAHYLHGFPQLVRGFGSNAFPQGTVDQAEEFAGAAVWLPPGVHPDEEVLMGVIETTVHPERMSKAFEALQQLDRNHPNEPHWYLPFIGVDTPRQGKGLGSALLAHALERVDRDHRPAYLETANPANLPLYQRHGFDIVGRVEVPAAPMLYAMVRPRR